VTTLAQVVRGVIDRLVREGTAVARSDRSTHTLFPVAASPREGEALRDWVKREGAAHTIEVGLGYGVSALFVCEGLLTNGNKTAHHVAIDPHQARRFADVGLQVLDEAGVARMVAYHADESQVVLPRLLAEGRRFDLAFVDGRHIFEAVFVDLYYLGRIVRPGGVVFVDDYQIPVVARAASFFATDLGWAVEHVSTPDEHHQWVVLRTPAEA
jgi:predicted O-methyltransferase YrrM